jgi:hypothetical protein
VVWTKVEPIAPPRIAEVLVGFDPPQRQESRPFDVAAHVACVEAYRVVPYENVEDDGMQIRSKTYLQMISWLRALHDSLSPNNEPSSREVSPLLIFVAVVLAVLLAMLEVDLYTAELQSLGLTGGAFPIDPALKGP